MTASGKDSAIRGKVLLNTISNILGKVTTLGVWFFLTPFILSRLGPSTYGLWILISSIVAYGSLLDFGITNAVAKYVAEYHARGQLEQVRELVATALWLYSALGAIAISLSITLALFFPALFELSPDERSVAVWLMVVSGLSVGISLPCTTAYSVLRGLQRFDVINVISITGTLLFAFGTVVALLLNWGVLGLVAVNIPITLVMQLPMLWFIRRTAPGLQFGWRGGNRQKVRTVTWFSSALFVINVAGQLQSKTDEIVIGAFMPIASVTPYSIARRLSEIPQMITDQFMKVIMPLASQLHAENDHVRLRSLYLTSTRLTLVIFIPIGCGLVILARPFLTIWVGPAYSNYAYLVLILTSASLIDTSQWPGSSVLQGMSRHRVLAIMSLGSALANLGLSIVWVRSFGLVGVALGTLIPTSVESLCFVLPYAMRVNGVNFRTAISEMFLPALVPAVPTVIVLYGLREITQPASFISIAIVGGIGLLVYGAAYLLMGANVSERQMIHRLAQNSLRFVGARFRLA